jgi:Uma2 family endonuclease
MSYAAYLEAERRADRRHEYLRGEVYAMAGGSPEHARLAAAVSGELRAALRGRPCAVFSSDLRVRIEETDRTTYPDVTVVCGERRVSAVDPDALTNPTLIVEILSDSTESDDRGEKFAHYRRLASLCEYVLVSQRARRVEVFRRTADGWTLHEAGPSETLRLASIEATLSVDDLYRDPLASSDG